MKLLVGKRKVNPLVISEITWRRGYRLCPENRRLYVDTYNKALPWYGCKKAYGFGSAWLPAGVIVYGADGSSIATVKCSSNKEAKDLCDQLNAEHEELLKLYINLREPI